MTLTDIEATLRKGEPLTASQGEYLRTSAKDKSVDLAAKAFQLLHAYPTLCHVSKADVPWLEIAADREDDAHIAANALSLLCDWLGQGQVQLPRLLRALASNTEGGDFLCITACSLAGQLLHGKPNAVLAHRLWSVFGDRDRPSGTREAARDALLVASGMSPKDIVQAERNGTIDLWKRASDAGITLLSGPS
jgi:hypothetical protein